MNQNNKQSFKLEDVDRFFSISLFMSRGLLLISCLSIIWGINIFATTNDFSGVLFFAAGSYTFFINARNVDKTKEYRTIVSIITTGETRSIDRIADIVNLPYDSVRKDLETMINKIEIKDIAIDDTRREVVLH